MGPFSAANHLLNFLLPALCVSVLQVLACRAFLRKRAAALSLIAQIAINFAVGCVVLAAGLALLGRDGKMLTYGALVLACASVQWGLLRGWR